MDHSSDLPFRVDGPTPRSLRNLGLAWTSWPTAAIECQVMLFISRHISNADLRIVMVPIIMRAAARPEPLGMCRL